MGKITPVETSVPLTRDMLATVEKGVESKILGTTPEQIFFRTQDFIIFSFSSGTYSSSRIGYVWSDQCPFPDYYGRISNQITELLTADLAHLSESKRASFHRLIATTIMRLMDDDDVTVAEDALARAREYLKVWNTQAARTYYFWAVTPIASLCVALGVLLWCLKSQFSPENYPVREGLAAVCAAAVGGCLSILNRLRGDGFAIVGWSGAWMYYLDGVIRMLVALIGGGIAALAFNLKLVLANFAADDATRLPAAILLGVVAGFSERLVTGIIGMVETRAVPVRDGGRPSDDHDHDGPDNKQADGNGKLAGKGKGETKLMEDPVLEGNVKIVAPAEGKGDKGAPPDDKGGTAQAKDGKGK